VFCFIDRDDDLKSRILLCCIQFAHDMEFMQISSLIDLLEPPELRQQETRRESEGKLIDRLETSIFYQFEPISAFASIMATHAD
jgi:hypothetical protein